MSDDSTFITVKHTEDGVSIGKDEENLIGAILLNTNFTPIKILQIDRDEDVPNLGYGHTAVDVDPKAPVVGIDMETGDIQYFYRDGKAAIWGRANLLLSVNVFKNTNDEFNNYEQRKLQVGGVYITREGKRVYCFSQINDYKYKVILDTPANRQFAQSSPAIAGYEVWFNGIAVISELPSLNFYNATSPTGAKSIITTISKDVGLLNYLKLLANREQLLNYDFEITYNYKQPNSTVTLKKTVRGWEIFDINLKELLPKPYVLDSNHEIADFKKFSVNVQGLPLGVRHVKDAANPPEVFAEYKPEDIIDDWSSPETRVFFAASDTSDNNPLVKIEDTKIKNWNFTTDKFTSAEDPNKYVYLEVHMRKIKVEDTNLPAYRLSENT